MDFYKKVIERTIKEECMERCDQDYLDRIDVDILEQGQKAYAIVFFRQGGSECFEVYVMSAVDGLERFQTMKFVGRDDSGEIVIYWDNESEDFITFDDILDMYTEELRYRAMLDISFKDYVNDMIRCGRLIEFYEGGNR